MTTDNPCGSAEIGQMLLTDKARHDAIARQWARTFADADADEVKLCLARQRLAFAQLGERGGGERIILHYDLEMAICARLGERGARPSYDVYTATEKEVDTILDERAAEEQGERPLDPEPEPEPQPEVEPRYSHDADSGAALARTASERERAAARALAAEAAELDRQTAADARELRAVRREVQAERSRQLAHENWQDRLARGEEGVGVLLGPDAVQEAGRKKRKEEGGRLGGVLLRPK